MRLEDKFITTLALVEHGKNIARLRPIELGTGRRSAIFFRVPSIASMITYNVGSVMLLSTPSNLHCAAQYDVLPQSSCNTEQISDKVLPCVM